MIQCNWWIYTSDMHLVSVVKTHLQNYLDHYAQNGNIWSIWWSYWTHRHSMPRCTWSVRWTSPCPTWTWPGVWSWASCACCPPPGSPARGSVLDFWPGRVREVYNTTLALGCCYYLRPTGLHFLQVLVVIYAAWVRCIALPLDLNNKICVMTSICSYFLFPPCVWYEV